MSLFIIDFLLMFPILYEAVVSGTENIDISIIDALRLETHKSSPLALTNVIVPMAWPYVILGIVQALGLGMKVSIMSEVLCGDDKIPGLGRLIYGAYIETNMPNIFALTLIAILLSGILDGLLYYLRQKYKN
jgi:NitT/TauT family transport system permease protein